MHSPKPKNKTKNEKKEPWLTSWDGGKVSQEGNHGFFLNFFGVSLINSPMYLELFILKMKIKTKETRAIRARTVHVVTCAPRYRTNIGAQ